ncbi:MAG: 50S ribosomal protein L9 [Candidatus Eremiobacteraeota bacterium]|nr:50S ribosomal protein L9 [Candidatus Eremiobacteraeota bacterium]
MKVILKDAVKDVGKKGQVVKVANGYARNFLFPKRLAVPATKSAMKALMTEKKNEDDKLMRAERLAVEKAEKIGQIKFKIKAKTGGEGKLYGSITNHDIADAIAAQSEFEIDKRKIELEEPIKFLGAYSVKTKIHHNVIATIGFEIVEEKE